MTLAAEALTDTVTAFGGSCVWTGVMSSDRPRWLEARRTLVTASDVAAIMGEDPYGDALKVYWSKVQPANETKYSIYDGGLFWGSVLEQPILTTVARELGWEYRAGGALLRSRRHPLIGATLDGEVRRAPAEPWIPLEGKTSVITRDWDEESGELPTRVLVQVQSQLLVTGASSAVVFALLQGCRACRVEIEPSPEYHAVIVEEVERFMELVRRLEPPPATARSGATLTEMFPVANDSLVKLGPESVEYTREINAINRQLRELGARKAELRNLLKQAVGPFLYGELPEEVDGRRAWKWAVEASGRRQLRLVKNIDLKSKATAAALQRLQIAGGEPGVADDEAELPEDGLVRIRGRRRGRR